jgi:cbb3-type cytochrome oxidase maturation protein
MKIIFFLIVLSLITATGFLLAFFWAVKSGQYEDDITPSMRLMIEEDMIEKIESKSTIK